MMEFLFVGIGGALGAPLRYLVDLLMQRIVVANHPRRLPIGTLTVNVLGSAILGVIVATATGDVLLLLGVGFCGAFTTFSTFMAQTDMSFREGWPVVGALNVALNLVLCFGAFWLCWSLFV